MPGGGASRLNSFVREFGRRNNGKVLGIGRDWMMHRGPMRKGSRELQVG
jgi:hypothetical protein